MVSFNTITLNVEDFNVCGTDKYKPPSPFKYTVHSCVTEKSPVASSALTGNGAPFVDGKPLLKYPKYISDVDAVKYLLKENEPHIIALVIKTPDILSNCSPHSIKFNKALPIEPAIENEKFVCD